MSDERKEWLLKHVDHVFTECRGHIEHSDSDCLNCLEGAETCYQVHEEIERLIQQKPYEGWLPTAENINALPGPVRKYIHDLQTNADPAGMVQENIILKNLCNKLEAKLIQVPVVKIKESRIKPERMDHMDKGAKFGKSKTGPEDEKFPYECCIKCDRLIEQFACKGVPNAIECLYLLSKMKIKKKGD